MTLIEVINKMKSKGFSVYENDSKPFNVNIVGIRSKEIKVNEFNDWMVVFWKYHGRWSQYWMPCTTLSGLYYLDKPTNPKGCAILCDGQYKSSYSLDLHSGKYKALCQRLGDVEVWRDNDKDSEFDFNNESKEWGMFGINCHRASSTSTLEEIGKYSAGCQVIQSPQNFDIFIQILENSELYFGNKFTYTLINES